VLESTEEVIERVRQFRHSILVPQVDSNGHSTTQKDG
jgi:uncharacterized protein YlzI (FlbEa/FlbD family)